MSHQPFTSWIRQPASIILIIVLVIMLLMLVDQSRQPTGLSLEGSSKTLSAMPPVGVPSTSITPSNGLPVKTPPAPAMGRDLPKIVQRLGAPTTNKVPSAPGPGPLTAPDLGSLLGRLEDKVKAEPNNINNRLLLAQTYNELGLADKSLEEVRAAIKQFPEHSRAKLVLASILSKRKNEVELKEAVNVLKDLRASNEVKQYLVEMYLGDAWIRMGEHQSAMDSWKLALESMPVSDNRRAKLEKGIADISAGNSGG